MDEDNIPYFRDKAVAILDAANKFRIKKDRLSDVKLRHRANGSHSAAVHTKREIRDVKDEIDEIVKKFNQYILEINKMLPFQINIAKNIIDAWHELLLPLLPEAKLAYVDEFFQLMTE